MSKRPDKNLIVGLDVGTSKVVAIVGELNEDGNIEVVGIGSHPSRGLKKGVVVNIESTVHSIQRAVEEAELMAGCDIHSVYTGIAGSHVRSLNSHGIVAIRDKEVSARAMSTESSMRRAPLRFRQTRKSCISCRRNSSSTTRKAFASRSACPACGWKRKCTW